MKITNNYTNPIVIGSTMIPIGATEVVRDWAKYADRDIYKSWVEANVISIGDAETKSGDAGNSIKEIDDMTKAEVVAELEKLGVGFDRSSAKAELVELLKDQGEF